MSNPGGPKREHPSTYVVPDRSSEEELARLTLQDQLVTQSMGGVLPEQTDTNHLQRLLDVGCGTGGWLIEAAKTYPTMTNLVGVDVSERIITYARNQANVQQVSDRVQFHIMDTLRMLEFPDNSFDLVNQRLGLSYLRTWDWPKLLQEYQRVVRRNGIIRITEGGTARSNSAALTSLGQLLLQALDQAGHGHFFNEDGVTSELVDLVGQCGLRNVQTQAYALDYRADTTEGRLFFEDIKYAYRTFVPFLRKWTRVPDNYEEIYQQAISDLQQKDFVVTWHLLTIWGNPSLNAESQPRIQH